MAWWRRLTGQPPVAGGEDVQAQALPPQREHMPDLHALKNRQTAYGGRADLLRAQIARALEAETYGPPEGEAGGDGRR